MTPLQEQVILVAQMRGSEAAAKAALAELYDEFRRTNATAILMAQAATQDLATAETKLREMVLAAYAETGDKKPVSGVAIQLRTRLKYDVADAVRWAISNWRESLLSINRGDFERVAKALAAAGADDALGFVELVQEPAATIATDLSAFATDAPAEALEVPF